MPVFYDPELYDLATPASFLGDVDWYVRKAREARGPVLELGAGTGRITLPIAAAGIPVHALDADARMLARLRQKLSALPAAAQGCVTLVESDMRRFEIGERFALVMIPFRAFLHNKTMDDQLACLRCVHRHLRPGGSLAFNVFHPSLDYMAHNAGAMAGVWRWRSTHPTEDGRTIVRSEANRYDTVQQMVRSQHRYEEFDSSGTLQRTSLHDLELAYLYAGDIQRLLGRAGFANVRIGGGFQGQAFERDSDELVVEAVRPR